MPNAEFVALANPLSSDMDVLRPSLLPGLIHSLRHNISRKNYDVALFEVGRVFKVRQAGSPSYAEERRVAIALTGQRALPFWSGSERDAKFDACDLKGVLEEFFEQFGLRGMTFTRRRGKHGAVSRIGHDSAGQANARRIRPIAAGAGEEI